MIFRDCTIPAHYMRPDTKAGTRELARRINELVAMTKRFPSKDFIDPTELLAKLNYWFGDENGELITTDWGYPLDEHDSTGDDGHKIVLYGGHRSECIPRSKGGEE